MKLNQHLDPPLKIYFLCLFTLFLTTCIRKKFFLPLKAVFSIIERFKNFFSPIIYTLQCLICNNWTIFSANFPCFIRHQNKLLYFFSQEEPKNFSKEEKIENRKRENYYSSYFHICAHIFLAKREIHAEPLIRKEEENQFLPWKWENSRTSRSNCVSQQDQLFSYLKTSCI